MKIDRAILHRSMRLKTSQVDGVDALVDAYEKHGRNDPRDLAYILATAKHETANTFKPIREFGLGKGKKYGKPVNGKVYYGRGFVQLTWDYNYAKAGKALGLDLLGSPDLAMVMSTSAALAVLGMLQGWFTGKKLGDYLNKTTSDWWNARRIINGTDKAGVIAGYAQAIHAQILASLPATTHTATLADIPPEPPPAPLTQSRINQVATGAAVVGGAVPAAKSIADMVNTTTVQVQTVSENVGGVVNTATSTVKVLKENHDTIAGITGWLLSPYVMLGFAAVMVILVLAIFFYRHKLKDKYGV